MKLSTVLAMSQEQRRVKIAELMGWSIRDGLVTTPDGKHSFFAKVCPFPDYLSDLNAIHEAENSIPDALWEQYTDLLQAPYWEATRGMSSLGAYSATAEQRVNAFLAVMLPDDRPPVGDTEHGPGCRCGVIKFNETTLEHQGPAEGQLIETTNPETGETRTLFLPKI